MDPSIFIDGTPASELGAIKSLGFTRSYAGGQGGGFRDARLTLDLDPGFQHQSLRLNAPVELRHGADSLGKGNIVSIDRNTWEIVVDGIVRLGEDYECRTDAGEPCGLATGLPAAIGRGLPWKIDPSLALPGDVVGQSMQSISEALNDFATQQNKSWLIDGDTLRLVSDPTTPSLMLMATDNPNSSTDGLVSVVTAKYAGAVDESGNPALISYVTVEADDAPKRVERTIDLTSDGAKTAADATAQAKAALTSGATSPLTESVQVSPGTLFTAAGADLTDILCTVREGQMVRQLDWVNPDGSPGLYRDWIIGGVDWSTDGGLVLTPVGGTAATLAGTIIDLRQGVDSAQGTADTALAVGSPDYLQSLITADSKTTGGEMPASAKVGDLWLNAPVAYVCTTAYTSGGTLANWTPARDPRTIALIMATSTAIFAADAAASDATVALTAANGKNSITGSNRAPTAADPGVEGDRWEMYAAGNISAVYTYASGQWVLRKLRDEAIDTLTVGKVVGLDATFVSALIYQLNAIQISAATTTWSAPLGSGYTVTQMDGSGISASVNSSPVLGGGSVHVKIKSGLSVSGGNIYVESGSGIALGSSRIYDSGDAIHLAPWNTATGAGYRGSGVVLDGLNTGGSIVALQVSGSGHMVIASSTRRFKTQIQPILDRYPLATLRAVAGVLFRWIDHPDIPDATKDGGFIAEQIASLGIEELVIRTGAGDILGVHYDRAVAFCWAMTAAAWDEIDELKADVAAIKTRLSALEAS